LVLFQIFSAPFYNFLFPEDNFRLVFYLFKYCKHGCISHGRLSYVATINDSNISVAYNYKHLFCAFCVHFGSAAVLTHIFFAMGPRITDKPLSETLMPVMGESKETYDQAQCNP